MPSWLREHEPALHHALYGGEDDIVVDELQTVAARLGIQDVDEYVDWSQPPETEHRPPHRNHRTIAATCSTHRSGAGFCNLRVTKVDGTR